MDREIMIKVDGAEMPCPSSFTWGLLDISAAESGRTDDITMHKNRVGQKRTIFLSWNGPTFERTSQILRAVNPEYINVTYPDALEGKYVTKVFYVGDRSAPFKCWWVGNKRMETLSFELIER